MLHNPKNLGFAWSFSSIASTRPDTTTWATSVTSGGAVNTKGTTVQVISGANVSRDVFEIQIVASNGNVATVLGCYLLDVMVDPAGGTNWSPVINNLAFQGPSALSVTPFSQYRFPLWIRAGSSIGVRTQCGFASRAMRVGIYIAGSPFDRRNIPVGTRVVTYGADTATSAGTAVTQGTTSEGSWTQLGTVASGDAPWFWQVGANVNSTSVTGQSTAMDLGIGDATNKQIVIENSWFWGDTSERGNLRRSLIPPYFPSKAGDNVYGRAQSSAAAQTGFTMAAYGVTG